MKKIKFLFILTVVMAIFTACGQDTEPSEPTSSEPGPVIITEPTSPPSQPQGDELPTTNIIVEDDSLPPGDGMVRSLLTNEWVDADIASTRPIAVMIPNEVNAIPHYSLSKASVLYEANVEYRMTRLMAIYEDWEELEKIGNIRSLRTYYIYWAMEWDAFPVHLGGPFFINELLDQPTTQTVDGNLGLDSAAFFRSQDRNAPPQCLCYGFRPEKCHQSKRISSEL